MVNQTITQSMYAQEESRASIWKRFMNFCASQEDNRLMWLGIALAGHGCVLTPLTLVTVLLSGSHFVLFILALVAMGIALVTNLAAMPTRVTIPAFLLSVVIDLVIIITAISIGFDITTTYI